MASILRLSALLLPLAASTLAQFVPAPTDLKTKVGYYNQTVRYKRVPNGTCELTPGVKSYSGYVDVEKDQHIFWWFFEARNKDPHDAPLTVWINGGPGSSSMIGLFEELGPCTIDADGNLQNNPYAWNNVTNMLFIDHPAQVGFSYSTPIPAYVDDDYIIQLPNASCPDYAQASGTCGTYSNPDPSATANSTAAAAPSMWKTLQGFMGAFPQYSRHDFNFATESYGGHYGPIFNAYLEAQNAAIAAGHLPGAHPIALRALLIGNGWYDPLVQYQAYYNFTVYPGNTYDFSPFNASVQAQMFNALYGPGNCYDRTLACRSASSTNGICSAADAFCYQEVEALLDSPGNRDEYDIRETYADPFPPRFYESYLNSPALQQAIGAYVNFSGANGDTVYTAFVSTGDDDREDGTVAALASLVHAGVYVILYAGDADYNCNWLGGQAVASAISAPGYASAGYTNISTSDKIVHGQVKQSANFAFARVYESGHEVPFYQPLASLELLERALCGLDVATGRKGVGRGDGYRTQGPAESTYREGNSTVQAEDTPEGVAYNTTLNAPNPVVGGNGTAAAKRQVKAGAKGSAAKMSAAKRSAAKNSRRAYKPAAFQGRNKRRGGA